MNIKSIQRKTEELFLKYQYYVQGVEFGKVGNYYEDSSLYDNFDFESFYFIFTMKNIPNVDRDIFPLSVTIDGEVYNTHFIRAAFIRTTSCDETGFFDQQGNIPTNRSSQRPIRGGLSVANQFSFGQISVYFGTLGLVGIDNDTNSVVTISNNHVYAASDSFISSERDISNPVLNNFFNTNIVQNNGGESFGKFKKYAQLRSTGINKVDAAVSTIRKEELDGVVNFDPEQSWKQWLLSSNDGTLNLNVPGSYKWATTSEIDFLIEEFSVGNDVRLWYSGARMGVVGLPTGQNLSSEQKLFITGFGTISVAGAYNQSVQTVASFNQISFRAKTDDLGENEWCDVCNAGGNSGSAIVAEINGEYKIVGLNFAGANWPGTSLGFQGYFCRIDDIAELLNVSEFTSETTDYHFSDEDATEIIDIPYDGSFSSDDYLDVDGKRFWQVGVYVP